MLKLFICVFAVGYCAAEKVIIIGAGAAGIATASRLLNNNITDFRILEAENRIGGRIHTFFLGDAFVDIGAQYVHGQDGNVIYQLAEEYLKHGRDIRASSVYYGDNRKTVDNLIEESFALMDETRNAGEDVLFGVVFTNRYNATILQKYKNDPKMLVYAKDLLKTIESFTLLEDGPFSWFKLAAKTRFKRQGGDEQMSWDGLGFETFLELLLKNFPEKTGYNIDNQLSLGKKVTKIILQNNRVKIKCQDGSGYISDHVVFTPSLGVLKHDNEKLFVPKLPKLKKEAIKTLGIDGVMKIIIEFPTAWWGEPSDFTLVWNEEKRRNVIRDIRFGPVKNGDHWLTWFFEIGAAPNNPRILIGWIVGPVVPEVEMLTEKEMKIGTLYALKTFLGKDFDISEPIKVIHSKWHNNPNFRGTHIFETLKSIRYDNPTAQEMLSLPITGRDRIPRILFAGEATNPNRFGVADGAVETGYREGDRLVEILTKKSGATYW